MNKLNSAIKTYLKKNGIKSLFDINENVLEFEEISEAYITMNKLSREYGDFGEIKIDNIPKRETLWRYYN